MRRRDYCGNPACGCGPTPLFDGECRTCYQYRYRTGRVRPPELVIRNAERVSATMMWNRRRASIR